MAKRKEVFINPLAGVEITIVCRKKGETERVNNMIYEEALKAMEKFKALGWEVVLYQKGFYQNSNQY